MSWWVTFEDRAPACVGVSESKEAALELASEHGTVTEMYPLPYPARPRLDTELDGWNKGQSPSFCYRPGTCKGRSACPRNPSCTS